MGGKLLSAVLLVALLTASGGCSPGDVGDSATLSPEAAAAPASTQEYLPGVAADVYLPEDRGAGDVPVVLLVPGGGWHSADRTGLAPLATQLAVAGFVAVNATYRAGSDHPFPEPVADVLCASGYAVQAARAAGLDPGPLVALGHSAGGHLAALAALGRVDLAGDCPFPVPQIDGLIGLAGVYDVRGFPYALVDFFEGTPEQQPEVWRRGDPVGIVDAGVAPDGLHVLLVHGQDDAVVPLEQSQAFATSLSRADVPVALDLVADATHDTIYRAEVAAPIVIAWINNLPAGNPPN